MREIVHFFEASNAYFIMGLLVLTLILLYHNLSLSKRLARAERKRNTKLEDGQIGDILDHLTDQSDSLAQLLLNLGQIRSRQDEQAEIMSNCLRSAGIIRFDAFDDVGGEQSFSLVLLDANRNGVALSSLYGRHDSRVYAKEIRGGKCEHPLSDEERNALSKALR